jgi:streptogramin lyase
MATTSTSAIQPGVVLAGTVHGGQQPVSGSHVYLYAASSTGYGAASTSLLNITGSNVTVDTSGNAYVTTNAGGNFTITSDYTCPVTNPEVYLVATQGNPGLAGGANNTALSLLSALGPCQSLTTATTVNIDEVSTAAAVTALQQFMVDEYHIGTSATNATGLANAFANVPNLVNSATGSALATTPLGNGAAPQSKLNTLGNILAPCVNSVGPTSPACVALFAAATPSGGTAPTDTATAMLSIAKNPGSNVGTLFGLTTAAAPFAPSLTTPPNDFALAVTYTGGGLKSPGAVVIDASGNAYTTNCNTCNGASGTDSIVGFGPQGAILTGSTGFTANIHNPEGLAIDTTGDIWVTNLATGSALGQVTKLLPSGTTATGFPYAGTLGSPVAVAPDALGNAWVSNQTGNSLVQIGTAGTLLQTVTNSALLVPMGVGIDGTGNVFAAASGSSDILKVNPLTLATTPYIVGGIAGPIGISIDNADNVWTIDNQTDALSIVNGTTGNAVTKTTGDGIGVAQAAQVAIDGAGTGWLANCRAGCPGSGSTAPDNLLHFNSAGTTLTASDGFEDSHLSAAGIAAIDGSGNIWVSNNTGASLTEFLGLAVPVKTPTATAASLNQLGVKP